MVQQFRALVALVEDLGSVPSTNLLAHSHASGRDLMPTSNLSSTRHTLGTLNIHAGKTPRHIRHYKTDGKLKCVGMVESITHKKIRRTGTRMNLDRAWVAHTVNPSTGEAEASQSLSLRLTWSTK